MTDNLATIQTWQAEIEVEIADAEKELAAADADLVAAEVALATIEARREELRGLVASISSRPLPESLRRRLQPVDSEIHNAIGAVTRAALVVEGIEHRLTDLRQAHAALADQIAALTDATPAESAPV